MKYLLLMLASFFLLENYTFCQADPVGEFNRRIAEYWKGDFIRIGQYRVKGSPFLLGQSFPGSITYKGGRTQSGANILYDLYNQKAGIESNNEIWENDNAVESFTITLPENFGGKKLLFSNAYNFNKPDLKGYLNVIEDGKKLAFLKLFKSRLIADPSNEMAKDIKLFEQYAEYYVYNKSTRTLSGIKLRKKDLAKEMNEEFIKSFIAINTNSDLSNEQNVIRLFNAYNATELK